MYCIIGNFQHNIISLAQYAREEKALAAAAAATEHSLVPGIIQQVGLMVVGCAAGPECGSSDDVENRHFSGRYGTFCEVTCRITRIAEGYETVHLSTGVDQVFLHRGFSFIFPC